MRRLSRRTNSHRRSRCLTGFLVLTAFGFLAACSAEYEPPPHELLGVWETSAPGYEDRSFEIRPNEIAFEASLYTATNRHPLEGVQTLPATDGWNAYRLDYREPDGEISRVEIHVRTEPTSTLRFANRQQIWTRRGGEKGSP
jgi:hypothetical protein